MMTKVYTMEKGKNINDMAKKVKVLIENACLDVQCVKLNDGSIIIQGKESDGKLFKFVGADRAITVRIAGSNDDQVVVEIGEGKWIDKVWGTVWGLWSWPVLLCTAVATCRQAILPKKICNCIERYLRDVEYQENTVDCYSGL